MTREAAVSTLAAHREKIDEIDRRLLAILNDRARTVEEIGRVKRDARLPIYEPRREDQVFANISTHNSGPLSNEAAHRIFERIIDEMRKIQRDRMEQEEKCS